jgi:chromosome segregation ATPase
MNMSAVKGFTFWLNQLFALLTFVSAHTLALSMAQIVAQASEAVELLCIVELEEANAGLRAELDEAHAKNSEVEGRKNVLKSIYNSLYDDYKNLETMLVEAQWEKTKTEKACDTIRDKFQRFHTHFHATLHDLHRELEKSQGELGGRCLDYPEMCGTIGGILN